MLYEDIVRGVVNSTKSITFELMNNDDDNDAFFLKRYTNSNSLYH